MGATRYVGPISSVMLPSAGHAWQLCSAPVLQTCLGCLGLLSNSQTKHYLCLEPYNITASISVLHCGKRSNK